MTCTELVMAFRAACLFLASSLVAATFGCDHVSSAANVEHLVGVTGLEDGRVVVVDVSRRRVVGHWGLAVGPNQSLPALTLDSTVLFYFGYLTAERRTIAASIDARRGTLLWKRDVPLTPILLPDGLTSVRLHGLPAFLAATRDTAELLVFPAFRDTTEGLAIYRAGAEQITRFLPIHVAARHVAVLRGRATLPRGTLVACATRRSEARPKADALFFIGPDLVVIDSVQLPPPAFEAYDVAVTPDERFAFVKSPPHIFKIDIAARRIVAQVQDLPLGFISLSASGDKLIATDPGVSLDLPGSGRVGIYTSELQPVGAIDLGALSPSGTPPTTWDVVTSPDDSLAYVVAGTPRLTLGQGAQEASLFVVDLFKRVAIARIPLNQYGIGRPYFIR